MNFIEAINAMRDGKGIRLPHWRAESHIKKDRDVESGYVNCLNQRVIYYQFKETEMLSDEWEIYREELGLHNFEEALAAYKCGNTIIRNIDRPEQARNIKDTMPCLFSRSDLLAVDWIILDK